jgi:hypothetical protein
MAKTQQYSTKFLPLQLQYHYDGPANFQMEESNPDFNVKFEILYDNKLQEPKPVEASFTKNNMEII